ncbi:MAG: ComF family protein [Propionibacteriaceae bacterium]|nr:ComF family protein [Propionibacteriaceae bacterium]
MVFIDAAADLLLGSRCPGCGQPGHGLCRGCRIELEQGRVRFVRRDPSPPGMPLTVAAGDYVGVMPHLVAGFKDERLLGLAGPLATRLALAVAHLLAALGHLGTAYHLVPIPSAPAAVRERSVDHTRLLAHRTKAVLRREAGLGVVVRHGLRPGRRVTDQVGLDAGARWQNREGHFRVAGTPPSDSVPILIDDVTTTGATLAAAARTFAAAGTPVLGAAVVAATVRRTMARRE